MRKICNQVLLILLLFSNCLLPVQARAGVLTEAEVNSLQTYILEIQAREQFPALAFALIQEDKILFSGGSTILPNRVFNANTPFIAAALTEPLVSLLAARLEHEGKLSLNDSAQRFDRRFRTGHGDGGRAVTLEHLLSQTAGIPSYIDKTLTESWARGEDVFTVIRQTPTSSPAGETYGPSQAGVAAAAFLLTQAADEKSDLDQGFARAMEQFVFAPLNMSSSHVQSGHAFAPLNGLHSTLNDLTRWLSLELNSGRTQDGRILASPALMLQRHSPQNLQGARRQGMGWTQHYYQMTPVISCAGVAEGTTALLGFLPEFKLGFVLWIESDAPTARDLAQEIPLALVEFLKSN